MASTKIINVLKDDKFEEILDLFRNASAKEVIFVLPKTSKAFKNEEHFVILENEAVKSDKKVSLLCSNPDTNKLAKKYKFDVLLAKDGNDKPLIKTVNQFDSEKDKERIEDERELDPVNPEEVIEADPDEPEESAPEVEEGLPLKQISKFYPAMYQEDSDENDEYQVVTVSKIKRGLEGIVKNDGKPLKITSRSERPVSLGLKKKPIYQSVDEIKNIWKEQSERIPKERINIWTGINSRTKKSFKNFPKKSLVALGVVSVILLGAIIYLSTGSANISLTPKKQILDMQLRVSASDKFSVVDAGLNRIPGQLFNIEKTASQVFQTTGEKEVAQKARGKITVYNEYGTTPQVLIATTRFQTSDGLVFRTLKGITVPGTKVENGKIIPGTISVEVIADKPGQSYNIPASKFSIPAFNERGDSGRYEKIYGKSDSAMTGGAIGKAKVVTDLDFNTAKQTLSDQVTKDVEDSLKTQVSGLKVINSSSVQLKAPESTAKVDEAADSFNMSIGGSIKTIGFKEDDLMGLIKQYIDKNQNLIVIPEKLTLSYDNLTFDDTNNTLTFTVNIKGNGYAKIDIEKIKTDLADKSEKAIKDYFKGAVSSSVESVKVVLSPFWVKRIPEDKERIKFQINY